MDLFSLSIISIAWLFLVALVFLFYIEKENYAAVQGLKLVGILSGLWFFLLLFRLNLFYLALPLLAAGIFLLLIFLIPHSFPSVKINLNEEQKDERLTIFSRMYELHLEEKKYDQFYAEFPHLKEIDSNLRALPGLLSPQSLYYNQLLFKPAHHYMDELEKLYPAIHGEAFKPQSAESLKNIEQTLVLKGKQLGAVSVGFTPLYPHHFYSIKGRGTNYGKPIRNSHQFAIAITVEMNKEAVDQAPFAPVIVESTKQYLHAGKVAIGLAEYIRQLGFDATAHIDANYEVICPLVAMDAGLGDIGRMGLLMTPNLGPRVRIAVVSTNLQLKPSKSLTRNSVQYFCMICKKCAAACPSQAIQKSNEIKNGQVRYRINHERCYGFWARIGTDCARCMSVCPYAHADNFFHRIIRFGINRNPLFAQLALRADHYIYGMVPKSKGNRQTSKN
ncbi:MAG: 4Fe-4S dicluster domain-containing protein [Prolixibacteraceae bacterium]